jgi:hypothetical protein
MADDRNEPTSPTLLGRLGRVPADQAAWGEFAEAGERLGMKVATVFVARSKVQRMLQEEVRKLEGRGQERREDEP